jgi:RHS repeat-associated protein
VRGTDTHYYHYNGIGSVTNLTDNGGNLIQSYIYDAFGNILQVDSYLKGKQTVTNPYRFSTKEYNSKSGLIYFGARYYDPKIGRFITPDPLTWGPDDRRVFKKYSTSIASVLQTGVVNRRGVIEPGTIINFNNQFEQLLKRTILRIGALNPQVQHRFVYVRNNPINFMDPYGLAELRQLWREFEQLGCRFVRDVAIFWASGFFFEALGVAICKGVISIPLGVTLFVVGLGLQIHGTIEFADWERDFGNWYRRMQEYRLKRALGEELYGPQDVRGP